jgi:xanthine dehydrogenase accessory factor
VLLRILPEGSAGVDDEHQATSVAAAGDADLALAGHEISHEQGTVTVRNPCLSGGALELFLEPSLPMPRVLVVGDSPIVRALKAIGPEVGLDVLATADEAEGELAPRAGDLALIVAAHGRGEVDALRAGLAAGIPYVGLVASVKRGAAVLADLRAEGVSQEQVSRVDSPAGLDIGARTAAEIALSILAEVIAVRRRDSDHVSEGTAGAETLSVIGPSGGSARSRVDPSDVRDAPSEGTEGPLIAVDPICGMTVVVVPGTPSSETEDGTAYFCCDGCRLTFERQRQTA